MPPHVILCGFGRVGRRVLDSLRSTHDRITVIDLDTKPDDPRLAGLDFFPGDSRQPELLKKAGIESATGIVIVTSDDLVNVATALVARSLNPTARIVVRMFNQNLIQRLAGVVKNTVGLSVSALTAPFIALTAVAGESLAAVKIGEKTLQIVDATIPPDSPLLGKTLAEVSRENTLLFLSHFALSPSPLAGEGLGVRGNWLLNRLIPNPDPIGPAKGEVSKTLNPGDTVVVCGSPEAVNVLRSNSTKTEKDGVLWAGRIRRFLRTARRTFAAVDLPVKIATITLFCTLFSSALVFRFGVGADWADSLYKTVAIVSTGAELQGENQPAEVKVFLSVLKIVGAALIAGFTAIFTNYLIRAKLGGAFEARKIPDAGHVVVCGLGNIGFRVIEELLRLGYSVVAIDKDPATAFAPTVRRMGVAVVIGDATVSEVLKQARVEQAKAVIAVTSVELANLEIALLVKELNPEQRVVLRLADPEFAQAIRDSAGIRYAFAVPALAGPAFASALLGDRVQSLVSVGSTTIAVCDITVRPEDDHLLGRTVGALAAGYRFLPLGLTGLPPFSETGIPTDTELKVGDVLTVAMELPDLERLIRKEPRE